jgi:DNA-binding transcriptional LysR family regulator
MHEFIALYPEIDVSLVLSDNELDLGMREADVAIRMVMPRQPGLVQRHLLTVRSHVYASHDYVQKYGKPNTADELDQHRLIIFGEDARAPVQDVNWLLSEGNPDHNPRLVVLRVNNTYGIFRAVESGLGIASLPDYLARESTKLEMLLPDLNVRTTDVYFTYPEELRHSKRIAVFRDFLLRKVAETRF